MGLRKNYCEQDSTLHITVDLLYCRLLQYMFPLGDFPGGSVVKNTPAHAGDVGLIPGSGRSPGEGNGNPLQYSCLGNPMDRGAGGLQSMGLQESRTRLSKRAHIHVCVSSWPSSQLPRWPSWSWSWPLQPTLHRSQIILRVQPLFPPIWYSLVVWYCCQGVTGYIE